MMKKTFKKVLQVLFLVSICTCFFPVCVHADGGTYINYTANTRFEIVYSDGSRYNNYYYTYDHDGRIVYFKDSNNEYRLYFVFNTTDSVNWKKYNITNNNLEGTGGCRAGNTNGNYYQYDNFGLSSSLTAVGFPLVTLDHAMGRNDAWNYTYGDSAVEPGPEPTNWGNLRDVSYSTSVAGNNSASMANKDIISWGFPYDTNNNDISECSVEVRAVRGNFTGTDKTNLFSKKAIDFVLDNSSASTLGTYPATQRKVEYTWAEICENLSIANFWKISAYFDNDVWLKEGWIYQARLINTEENYTGDWQTLYTGTSASAEGSEMIVTNNSYDVNVYQALQEITVVNNNTSVVFTYQDTDINITNPDDGTEPSGGTNLWDVLKQLITGIFQILAKLGDLVGDLIGSITELFRSLFTPQEIDQTINNDVNVNINTYLEDDQPGLNDIHTNIDTWKLQLEDIADDYASGGDCILQWNDVAMNLSVFGAGNVTFIPAGTYDLKSAFLNLLSGFGVSYSTYQMLVSAVIYISLIVLISHKVKGFLKT